MTVELRKYVRVYYDDLAREYPEVYASDALGWTWLRLLVVAEKMWPADAELPRSIKPRPLARLVELGLVTLMPAHCYRIRGLNAERTRRQDAARNAAAKRWHSGGNAIGNADEMPRRERAEDEIETKVIPPPPAERGRRKNGTNPRSQGGAPRQTGDNPRSAGTSPRQVREDRKHGGLDSIAAILARANAAGTKSA